MRTRTHHTVRKGHPTQCFPCPLATGMIATENDRTSGK
jgi:hypothetical protein